MMRKEGIPTSQQSISQTKNDSGRQYQYEVPRGGSGTKIKSVQQQTMDRSHPGEKHWEAGDVKTDPFTGEIQYNKYRIERQNLEILSLRLIMTSERQKTIIYRANIREYLQKLNCFLLRSAQEGDLLSHEETLHLRTRAKPQVENEVREFSIPFEEKTSDQFQNYLRKLSKANSSAIYVWIDRTIDCGTIAIPSLTDFNWSFAYDCDPDGTLTLVTTDLEDRMLLDYSEDNQGKRVLEVKVTGNRWSEISYHDQ